MSVFYTGESSGADLHARSSGSAVAAIHNVLKNLKNRPGIQTSVQVLLTGAAAFALAPCAMGSLQLPVLVGFLFALKPGWTALFAAAMGCVSGAIFWQGAVLAQLWAGIMGAILCTSVLSFVRKTKKLWLQGALCAAVTAGLGFLFSQQPPQNGLLLPLSIRTAFSVASYMVFFLAGNKKAPLAIDGAMALGIMGLCQVVLPWGLDLGFILGAAAAGISLPMALFCGIAMDLAGITPVPMSAILSLSALVRKWNKAAGIAAPAALCAIWGGSAGSLQPGLWVSLLLGGCAALRPGIPRAPKKAASAEAARLMAACNMLGLLADNLKEKDSSLPEQPVCSLCHNCPRQSEQPACEVLREGIPLLLESGQLPRQQLQQCPQADALSQRLEQSIESLRLRQQYQSKTKEQRNALYRQYHSLSRFLLELAMPQESPAPCRYQAEVGSSTVRAPGQSRSGDRAAWFSAPGNRFYVLLCDGMGTGRYAAKAGQQAVELLRGLLTAGMDAEAALITLNDHYVLRDEGGLSAVDLLELRLDSGRAILYKWGGAPSYCKLGRQVKRFGTAAPPPGLGIGEDCKPEVIRLSMQRGQMLVLVSDGLAGEEIPNRMADCTRGSPQAMADRLTKQKAAGTQDDCTAVAVCLNRL